MTPIHFNKKVKFYVSIRLYIDIELYPMFIDIDIEWCIYHLHNFLRLII